MNNMLVHLLKPTAFIVVCALAVAGCSPRGVKKDPPVVPDITSTSPTLSWEVLTQPQSVVLVEGLVGDAEQLVSTLLVSLESDKSGELWRGNPRADGRFAWAQPSSEGTYWLVAGEHQLTVSVTDSTGETTFETRNIDVQPYTISVGQDTGDTATGSDEPDTGDGDTGSGDGE